MEVVEYRMLENGAHSGDEVCSFPNSDRDKRLPVLVDPQMRCIARLLEQVARSSLSLLLLGETGSGKEVLADWAHRCSRLAHRPLVRVNCAGLTESLIESELFGHERGAFTGAVQTHQGVFEAADDGTLFLDEVAELPPRTQAKLLRVLETGEFTRLGSRQVRRARVRLIAATHTGLMRMLERGEFRKDLYFRLNGATVEVPPLRARRSEIVPLAECFLARLVSLSKCPRLGLSPCAIAALTNYDWPGNVRELRNVIECAAALCRGRSILADHLMLGRSLYAVEAANGPSDAPGEFRVTPERALPGDLRGEQRASERRSILAALAQTGGNQTRAALLLGISRRTLTSKLTLHAIERPRKRETASRASGEETAVRLRSLDTEGG